MKLKILSRDIHIPLNGLNVSRQLEYKQLMQYLNLQGSERLLDVACGDGYWTAKMIPQAADVVGFDLKEERLQQARLGARAMLGVIRNDAHHLPFKDGAFDCAVGICVLEHFADDLAALGELRRVMKAGGKLALSVDSFTYPGSNEAERVRHMEKFSIVHLYSVETLKEKLSRSGFELDHWTYLLRDSVSAALYRLALRAPKLAYGLFPISYPLSVWSERRSKNQTSGYKLALVAQAV